MVNQYIQKKGEYLIYKIDSPFLNIEQIFSLEPKIKNFNGQFEDFFYIYFRWSRDGIDFSEWMEIDNTKLNLFDNLSIYKYNFYLHFKIECKNDLPSPVQIEDFLIQTISKKDPKTFVPFSIKYASEKGNRFFPVSIYNATFDPYEQTEAIRLLKELSYQNNHLLGISCLYIKADSLIESKDLFLLEWGLYNYQDPVKMKVIIPDNTFGSKQINFTGFGMDWELPFEVMIDKRYFESIFGLATSPQKYDAIYIPMQDRIYQIESSMAEQSFMNEPVHFKLSLQKYNKQTNISQTEQTKEFLDNVTTGIYEMFDNDMKVEQNKVTNPQQLNDRSIYNDRRKINLANPNLVIKTEDIYNKNVLISRNNYNFTLVYDKLNSNEPVVIYNILNEEPYINQSIMFWTNFIKFEVPKRKIKQIFIEENTIKIFFNVLPQNLKVNDLLGINISTNDDLIFYGKILEVSKSKFSVVIEKNKTLYTFSQMLFPNWEDPQFLFDNVKAGKIYRRNYLSNYDIKTNIGYDISILDNSILELNLNDKIYYFKIKNNLGWTSFILQILPDFSQISLHHYKFIENDLVLQDSKILNQLDIPKYQNDNNYYIKLSPNILTNLRVFTSVLKEEDHKNILNQNLVVDAQYALLIDNANEVFNSPFVGNVK